MNDGRAEWLRFVNPATGRADVLIARRSIGFRDALMVSGFDLLGHNRTFQVHWLKRVVAFFLDLITVFAPLWSFLYLEAVRAPWVYGVAGGVVLFAYSTFSEAITRTTVGKFIVGLVVDGDPRQRWSDKILGTTVAQSHLIHVRVHPIEASDAGGR